MYGVTASIMDHLYILGEISVVSHGLAHNSIMKYVLSFSALTNGFTKTFIGSIPDIYTSSKHFIPTPVFMLYYKTL